MKIINIGNLIKNLLSIVLTTVIYLLGGVDIALKSLLIVICIDYITGVLSAIYNKKLNSKVGFKGIIKKFSYFCIIALSVIIDKILGQTGVVRSLVLYFFVANDGISILENSAVIYPDMPEPLKKVLLQLRDKKEGDR